MSDAVLIALIGAILGGGGLLAKWLESRKDHSPIDRDTAEVALAHQSVEVAGASLTLMQAQVQSLMEAQRRSDERYDALEAEFGTMRIEVRNMNTILVLHLSPILDWLDAGAPPPPPVVHEDLRRLVLALADKESED